MNWRLKALSNINRDKYAEEYNRIFKKMNNKITIKFVKAANQFCVTYFEDWKQCQKWFSKEKEAQEFVKELKELPKK